MGLSIASTVLTTYKADTSDHKRGLRELRSEEKKVMKAQLDSIEARNAALDKHIKMIGKVTLAIGATVATFKLAQGAFNDFAKDSQLRTAAAGADLSLLKKASGGLRSEIELLDFAAGALNTTYKLNSEEMAIALKASRSLTKQGNDANEVFKAMKQAVVEGATEPLKKYGINLDEVSGRQNKQIALMKALREEAGKFGGDFDIAGDDIRRTQVSMSDSFRELSVSVGELVASLTPLFNIIAKIVGLTVKMVPSSKGNAKIASNFDRVRQFDDAYNGGGRTLSLDIGTNGEGTFSRGSRDVDLGFATAGYFRGINKNVFKGSKKRGAGRGSSNPLTMEFDEASGGGLRSAAGIDSVTGGIGNSNVPLLAADIEMSVKAMEELSAAREVMLGNSENIGIVEAAFGPLSQFSAYAEGFNLLTTAASAGFAAWIDGTKGIKEAMKDAVAGVLKTLAMQMLGESIKHAAYATAYSFSGNPLTVAKARGEWIAAAKFGAGAAALGVMAKGLGGQGASAGSGGAASAGASVRGTNRRGDSGGSNVTVVLGSDFSDDSPRRSAARIRRAVDKANSMSGNPAVVHG